MSFIHCIHTSLTIIISGLAHAQVLLDDIEHFLGGDELDRNPVLEVTNNPCAHASEGDGCAHCRTNVQFDGGARERDVDDLAIVTATVVQDHG